MAGIEGYLVRSQVACREGGFGENILIGTPVLVRGHESLGTHQAENAPANVITPPATGGPAKMVALGWIEAGKPEGQFGAGAVPEAGDAVIADIHLPPKEVGRGRIRVNV